MKRKAWMSAALTCGFFVIAFRFGENGVQWFWTGDESVALILGILAVVFGTLWFFEARTAEE